MHNNIPPPLVTVCCVTYNHRDFIRDCLNGFLIQETSFDFEIAINDDASTDGTQEILKDFQQKYPGKFTVIYQEENQWSKGIKPNHIIFDAKGKYIALCEGDDYWTDPYKLQKQVDVLEANEGYSASMHRLKVIFQNKPDKQPILNGANEDYDGTIEDVLSFRLDGTASLVFRKELITPYFKYFQDFKNGDTSIFLVLATQGKIKYFEEPMGVYRRNDQGITNHNSFKGYNYFKQTNKFLVFSDKYTQFRYSKIILESKLKIMEWIKDERLSILSNLHLKILKKYYHFCLSVNFRFGIIINKYLKV